jgi:hypothetical protein
MRKKTTFVFCCFVVFVFRVLGLRTGGNIMLGVCHYYYHHYYYPYNYWC